MRDSGLTAYVLVGATCSGKSAVAQILAERHGCAIVSADSMLVYRGMNIGTAKPSPLELRRSRTRMVDVAEPSECYSAGLYWRQALAALRDIRDAGRDAIVAGGSGLYLKALLSGLNDAPGPVLAFRKACEDTLRREGIEALRNALRTKAPELATTFNGWNNARRLVRALEKAEFGEPSAMRTAWKWPAAMAPVAGLRHAPDILKRRIAERVEIMYREGLLNEVEELTSRHAVLSQTARHAIGYAEALACLEGRLQVSEAKALTITRTCQLAKRQNTWFRTQMNVVWTDVNENEGPEQTAETVEDAWRRIGPTPIAE